MATPGTYQRLVDEDELKPLSEAGSQPSPQPPQYAPYAIPVAAAHCQQANNNNVVVATQPTAMPPVRVVNPQLKPKPVVMIVTIVLTAVCLVLGNWPGLVCLTPALIAAVVGFSLSDAASAEQRHTAKAFHAVAICCNIATVVFYVLMVLVGIIYLAVYLGVTNQYRNYDGGCYTTCDTGQYDYHYDYQDNYYYYTPSPSNCYEICS